VVFDHHEDAVVEPGGLELEPLAVDDGVEPDPG
jgi:hypothetical protein